MSHTYNLIHEYKEMAYNLLKDEKIILEDEYGRGYYWENEDLDEERLNELLDKAKEEYGDKIDFELLGEKILSVYKEAGIENAGEHFQDDD